MLAGCFTAMITPFHPDGSIDYDGLDRLVDFQVANGITGLLAVGTTGESPSFDWDEHNAITERIVKRAAGRCLTIAGTGSNNTREAVAGSAHAAEIGADAVLLVDPYYNGPSSLEIRREYVAPIAAAHPSLEIVPYIIPGRTGTQMMPEDLALLFEAHRNVGTVKEATGDLDNMRRTRALCGPEFSILSGDDNLTFTMMTDPAIQAAGVISVYTNLVPKAIADMVACLRDGDAAGARRLNAALEPIFGAVNVSTREATPHGEVLCRARNPLPLKTLMALLGLPAGPCRPPLGKMTAQGLDHLLSEVRRMHADHPHILAPAAEAFDIDIDARLNDPAFRHDLFYESY